MDSRLGGVVKGAMEAGTEDLIREMKSALHSAMRSNSRPGTVTFMLYTLCMGIVGTQVWSNYNGNHLSCFKSSAVGNTGATNIPNPCPECPACQACSKMPGNKSSTPDTAGLPDYQAGPQWSNLTSASKSIVRNALLESVVYSNQSTPDTTGVPDYQAVPQRSNLTSASKSIVRNVLLGSFAYNNECACSNEIIVVYSKAVVEGPSANMTLYMHAVPPQTTTKTTCAPRAPSPSTATSSNAIANEATCKKMEELRSTAFALHLFSPETLKSRAIEFMQLVLILVVIFFSWKHCTREHIKSLRIFACLLCTTFLSAIACVLSIIRRAILAYASIAQPSSAASSDKQPCEDAENRKQNPASEDASGAGREEKPSSANHPHRCGAATQSGTSCKNHVDKPGMQCKIHRKRSE